MRRWANSLFSCRTCHRGLFSCECGWVIAGVIATVVSVLATGVTTYMRAQAEQQQARAQSRAAQAQADQLTLNAAAQSEQVRTRNRLLMGAFDAQAGRAGVNPYEGSLLQNKKDSAQAGEYNAELAGFGARTGAVTAGYDARLFQFRAGQINPGLMGFGSTLASAASSVATGARTFAGSAPGTGGNQDTVYIQRGNY